MKNPLLHLLETDIEFRGWYFKALDDGIYVHAMTKTPNQWSHLDTEEKEARMWYLPICSLDEIKKIFSPTDVSGLLLKYRADSVISNMRILRTFEKRACYVKESEWTLTDQFDDSIFRAFNDAIGERCKKKIDEISFGTIFSDDPNGYCIKTVYGPLVLLSEALSKFFYFMNLSIYPYWYGEGDRIFQRTQQQSLILGIRTMLLTESFDFEMDPRGPPPEDIDNKLQEIGTAEMLFVIAHECAHFLLNHLDDKNVINRTMSYTLPSKPPLSQKAVAVYNQPQIQEFEADSFAIEILSGDDPSKKGDLLLFAVTVMSYFDIFGSLIRQIKKKTTSMESHPSSYERRKRLSKIGKRIWNQDELTTYKAIIKISKFFKENVIRLYNSNPSLFATYGSIYLDQWRGKPKIDRIDY